ncbi:amino acid adenylation domain-containing protein [Massilia sp. W12]|uniref:non-ribosomal peptide synthetase/type I polyketide synthase n=1 Tax=Massilia sp. W12 TaxID=3126507 RepID=UPI0030CF6D4F
MKHSNLYQALQQAAQGAHGVYLVEGSQEESFLSYHELQQQALGILAALQAQGVQAGHELILQCSNLASMIPVHWACIAGGIISVPLELGEQAAAIDKVLSVWGVLEHPWLYCDDAARVTQKIGGHAQNTGRAALWQEIEARLLNPTPLKASAAALPNPGLDDLAFIQFSSGSTGTPKGVRMSHRNLLTNVGDILGSIAFQPEQRFLTWKPITHDFAMIAFHLTPVVADADQVHLSTDAFVWNPTLWFAMVDKYRAAILGSPNFGYRHFLKLFKRGRGKKPQWDLSCVRVIINGAEPISQELCEEFLSEMAPYGLPRQAMKPAYGLAEATLIVSLCPQQESGLRSLNLDRRHLSAGEAARIVAADDANAANFVDCGLPYPHTQVRITDSARQALPPGHIGHIEIRGPAVSNGYYRNPAATAATIDAEGWLNTQDLGLLHEGRLHVVGRVKEMIIIGGVNYFPHDIEQAILRAKGENQLNKYIACGAFDAQQGSEQLLIFIYHKKSEGDFATLAREVRQIVRQTFGLDILHVVPVARIPKTTSGKVQRYLLVQELRDGKYDAALTDLGEQRSLGQTAPAPAPKPPASADSGLAADEAILQQACSVAARLLDVASIDPDRSFFELGFTSLRLLNLKNALEESFQVELDSTSALDFPTVRKLAGVIAQARRAARASASAPSPLPLQITHSQAEIAIVACACRFPASPTPAAYWDTLRQGRDPVRPMPAERWQADPQQAEPLTTREGGFLDGIDQFDPLFFNISPAEAQALDPQHRLLLEVAHEALENAGWAPSALQGVRGGVFIGISTNEYQSIAREQGEPTGPYSFTGSMFNTAAGRLSYTFGLQGPCVAIDTACSSSLVAVAQAMRELRAGSCDMALAGGVSMILKPDGHISFSRLNALAASNRCRSFDDSADGYIRSEGCGIVVMKRLSDAERDGDRILAIVKGAAMNHNGRSGGLTVPSGPAQQSLIEQALQDAGLAADEIDYVEAHGSGTRLGDPQELNALAQVFKKRSRPLKIGSVKSNLGHLESAAGVAGLIKLILMLNAREFAPNLHFHQGNRLLDWSRLPLQVVDRAQPWEKQGRRAAGISSFGINGSNAHLILQEYQGPAGAAAPAERAAWLFSLSAKSPAALRQMAQDFAALAERARQGGAAPSLGQVCRAVNYTRSSHDCRYATVVNSYEQLEKRLRKVAQDPDPGVTAKSQLKIGFLFTGQGSLYPQIAASLLRDAPEFASAFAECDALFAAHLQASLRDIASSSEDERLRQPLYAQALIFCVEYALCRLWQALGVRPALLMGHSIGEYVAACEAGVLSLGQAVQMVALRGRLMQDAPADGAMLGVLADQATVERMLAEHPNVWVAAVNTAENVTVSGEKQAVAGFAQAARKARIFTENLPMQHAFHTPHMQASAQELAAALQHSVFHDPRLPLVSSQSGQLIQHGQEIGQAYWSRHLCQPVLFLQALQCALAQEVDVFIEIGGTAALSGLGAQIVKDEKISFLPSLRDGRDAWEQMQQSAAALWLRGQSLHWHALYGETARSTPGGCALDLPNTAWQRSRYWHVLDAARAMPLAISHKHASTTLVAAAETQGGRQLDADFISAEISETISMVTGVPQADVGPDAHLFSLGIDSLMLTQIDKRLVKRFGVEIPVKLFFSELDSPQKIARHILANLSPATRSALQAELAPTPAAAPAAAILPAGAAPAGAAAPAAAPGSALEALIQSQLNLMREQLALLRGEGAQAGGAADSAAPARPARRAQTPANPSHQLQEKNALRDITLHEEDVTPLQLEFIRQLAQQITDKTPQSRAYATRYRGVLADWIATLNFSLTTKEMAYPIVSARSKGAYFWDQDGNRYIDTACGYGAMFFGHNPDFIVQALQEQIAEGFELGPQSDIAGEVASLIAELTGAERVAFCNSGTEAVMVAVRLARAVTRRNKVVRFINSYHGSADTVLADAGEEGAVPVAPGILPAAVEDTVVLHYGSPGSLQAIRALGEDLAAVLVEPVQSRNPENYSQDYLQQLRAITSELGAALIFDEMITGFRSDPGGVQKLFGVRADLATYGKVVGGGMPIGVVAGSAWYMDAIDGGAWQFGDRSGPSRETTFFAGTFCKHPLAMAAARAVLLRLKSEGATLIAKVNRLTQDFIEQANAFFEAEEIPIRALRFGSLYRFENRPSRDPARISLEMNLLFKYLLLDGVYFWERRTAFFSLAHSEEDAAQILQAIKRACAALRAGGFEFRAARAPQSSAAALPAPSPAPLSYPLSSEERRMYVLSLMKGGEDAYHVSGALRLRGPLQKTRLEQALRMLTARHPTMRTAYVFQQGGIWHRCEEQIDLPLLHAELSPGQSLDAHLNNLVQSFDLARAPLWRAALVRITDQEHVLLLDMHHLISDGISMSILIEEMFRLYQGESLSPVAAHYADFVAWEQKFVQTAQYRAQLDWWQQRLTPMPPLLELPADFARPPQNDFAGGVVRFVLGAEFQQGVKAMARAQRATPFMLLLSTYFLFLHKLSLQEDICIGAPFDRRRHGNFEQTVGMFAQTLIVRAQPQANVRFDQLLEEVRNACTDAYDHSDCSLEEIVDRLKLTRDFSRNPLFDTMFIFENGNRRLYASQDLQVEPISLPMRGSPFDLTLEITEEGDNFHCALIYASRLFQPQTVERWAGHYRWLLQQVLQDSQQSLSTYQVVDPAQRLRLLDEFNRSQRNWTQQGTLAQLLRKSAQNHAQLPALTFGSQILSYAKLDAYAHNLAQHILQAGVTPGELVGILLPRGPGMIASMLAVLMAGAAYVPLDPDYPPARLQHMLQAGGMRILLGDAGLAQAAGFSGLLLEPESLRNHEIEARELPVSAPEDLAYVIFTSGSTGAPKGVMLEQRSVLNFLFSMEEKLGLPAQARTLGLTTISFDIFVLEVFLTLLRGGCLCLASEQQQRDPQALANLLQQQQVQVMQATPSRLQMLLSQNSPQQALGGLHTLLVGGEALPPALLTQLQSVSGLRIFNVYGPTETTVWSSIKDLSQASQVSLGGPLANTRLYVLDGERQLRPIGCHGELYIAGEGLARGYLHDAEKTAAAFVPDPFAPGEKMYRTGDLAAWTADGNLLYRGRSDNQIKLRGYRIEIGEIEHVLQSHPEVRQGAVAVRELSSGNPVLVGYCVAQDSAVRANLAARLRQHCAQALPDYMTPAFIMVLDELPSTPNGKLDRRALPALPQMEEDSMEAPFTPDALEAEILAVWQEILGARRIGPRDSFFDVGGNSFSLVAMHGRLSEKYPDALEVADIFANPTIAALKAQIEAHQQNSMALPEILLPGVFFAAAGAGAAAENISAALDADASRRLQAQAQEMALSPAEFSCVLFLLYLHKLLNLQECSLPTALGAPHTSQMLAIDFKQAKSVAGLSQQLRQAQAKAPLRTLAGNPAREGMQHGALMLFASGNALPDKERAGHDLVLRMRQQAGALMFSLDYDASRLDGARLKPFLLNYLKLIKALLGSRLPPSEAKAEEKSAMLAAEK